MFGDVFERLDRAVGKMYSHTSAQDIEGYDPCPHEHDWID